MTFACKVKQEITKSNISKRCCAVAEIYGILLVCTAFSHTYIKIVTENKDIAKRIPILFKKAFNINISPNIKNNKHIFEIDNPLELTKIFNEFGYDHKYYINYNLNRNVVDAQCCTQSFFKGLFQIAGTVASPEKKTHLEISTTHNILSREILALMLDFSLKPKENVRKNHNVIYFKESSAVEDFLTIMSASNSAMEIMDAKAQKEIRNEVNRRVNCETANLTKTVDASIMQIDTINKAIEKSGIDIFPNNLHDTIKIRQENKEKSLSELAEILGISKSAINHRLRKIMQIAKENI